jgi:hypothetical protein
MNQLPVWVSSRKKPFVWGFWLAWLSVLSCSGGTETGNPATLTDFSSSDCKNQQLNEGSQGLSLASDVEGLQCVEWQRSGDALQLRLLNFPVPCGDTYLGAATITSAGVLELSAYKDVCAVFKCGLCVFDFEYELSGISRDEPLAMRVGSAACESAPVTFRDELALPVDAQDSGIVCRYLDVGALDWYARGRGSCGERNMPCGSCDSSDEASCDAELQCRELGEGDSRCLPTCSRDDDCVAGVTSCRAGVCQARADW